jgi:hypothetical protein
MPDASRPTASQTSPQTRELHWSPAEKAIARKAFERALAQELAQTIQETKQRAAKVAQPDDLWSLERYLTRCRNQIDEKYDYRYSVLPIVLGTLIREGHLSLADLEGLGEDKLRPIRAMVAL